MKTNQANGNVVGCCVCRLDQFVVRLGAYRLSVETLLRARRGMQIYQPAMQINF
jgi:hypothetical protein